MSGSNAKKSIRRKRSQMKDARAEKRAKQNKDNFTIPAMNYRGSNGKHFKIRFTGKPKG